MKLVVKRKNRLSPKNSADVDEIEEISDINTSTSEEDLDDDKEDTSDLETTDKDLDSTEEVETKEKTEVNEDLDAKENIEANKLPTREISIPVANTKHVIDPVREETSNLESAFGEESTDEIGLRDANLRKLEAKTYKADGESLSTKAQLSSTDLKKIENGAETEDPLTGENDSPAGAGSNPKDPGDELELGSEFSSQELKASQSTEPNYAEDEKNIKDYSDSERYRETDLQPGNTNQESYITDQGEAKDGLEFNTKNPSADSPSKTECGYQITIDKKTGQRTYTKVYVTDSGLIPVDKGNKPMMSEGDKLTSESPDVTYKSNENTEVTASRSQRNLNYEASEETLKHINNKDNPSTSFGMEDNYAQENPGVKFFGDSFALGYKVNPWPNENDKLEELKLNKNNYDPTSKYFVQGQDIDTKIKVDNVDENAKERLVGQVYNPITGEIVPGARAYIGKNGNIHIKMPEGALKKDANGKAIINEDSIFNTPDYKALQNLDVKFFARPRTAEEFRNIADTPDEFGETGSYTETGAGTTDINHKGTNVTIDKQGIDRYDHYNLIGDFKLNLDDTRYYDQRFIDGNDDDTSKNTSSAIKPGEPFEVKIYEPEDSGDYQKSSSEMNAAEDRGETAGKVILDFVNKANEGKEDKDQWKVTLTDGDVGKFSITPPKSAKAGDFIAVPVEYTYTNGSKDTHWFHFVVQESDNYRPEYHAEIGFRGDTLTSRPDPLPSKDETKKNLPLSYELVPGTYKDSAGNVWDNITVDKDTGVVTATVPEHADIKGGENLFVDIKVNYIDEYDIEKEETVKAQFIARPKYKEEVTNVVESKIPYKTNVVYDDTLEAGKVVETPGSEGTLKTTFKQVVINGEKGIINDKGEFIKGEEALDVETITKAVDGEVRIGTKPVTTEVDIPRDTDYVIDYNKDPDSAPETIEEGSDGTWEITTTRNPNTGEISIEKRRKVEPKNRKVKIGAKTEGILVDEDEIPFKYDIEFDPDFYTKYPDAKDNYYVVTEGKSGSNKKTWTIVNSEKVGDPVVEITEPIDAVIKVGQKDYTGTVTNKVTKEIPYTVKIVENPDLEAGKSNIKQKGKPGSKTYEYTGEIVNGALKEGKNFTEKELTEEYKEPVEEIIEIGTKPANNEKSIENSVGVEVEYVYDNTKEKGYRNIEELVPGKVVTKVVNKYNPKTGQIETTEETTVIPGRRKVTFGTKDHTGEYDEVSKKIIPYKTEIVFDDKLEAGEKVTDQPGENGDVTTTTRRYIENGEVVKSDEPVTKETKKVQNQIIRVGTMTDGKHSHTEKIPFEYEIDYDENLKAGEYVIDVEGEEGSKTTEWDIKNSEVVEGSASITEHTPATNAKIRVGKKDFTGEINHKETFEIPFEVEIRYNDKLPAGKTNEIQKGVKGSYDVEYTQKIKNGEADGEMTKTETGTVEAKKHIIEVGTKVETPENNYSKDVEVEIEYVYDDTEDKGYVKTGELTPGKVETKVVDKYNPETGKIEQTSEEVVTSAKQKVIVGTKDFTGTYEYKKTCPIPFEVEVIEDDTLSKGEKKVDQEGKPGSKTTSYEQDIKNGNPEGKARKISEETTEDSVKHIVRVGTKPLEGKRENVVDKDISYETKVIYDENLEAGNRIVDNEGKDGKERVTTTITTKDGDIEVNSEAEVLERKEDRVIRVGVKPVVKEEAIPHDTSYTHNPELKAGEVKKIKDGTPGKVIVTTSFNKETGELETKVERTEPTNDEYGSKTTGEIKFESEIPFEVEIIEDDKLDAGTYEVEQEGEVGEKETTLVVESSEEKSRKEEITKEAKKKIIRIGTKPNEDMCPIPEAPTPDPDEETPEEPETPGETPEKPEEPGTPGENPEKPEEPKTPGENPERPEEPGTSGETPEKPEEPETPEEPGASEEKPGKPNEPAEEKTPDSPKENHEVEEKVKAVKKAKAKSTNPKTGIGSVTPILSSLGISIAGLLATKKKMNKSAKRKNR